MPDQATRSEETTAQSLLWEIDRLAVARAERAAEREASRQADGGNLSERQKVGLKA